MQIIQSFLLEKSKFNFFICLFLSFLIFFSFVHAKQEECQGAKIRIINKITAEKTFYDVPLSQTLKLDNAKIKILRCVKIEKDGKDDEIALISHKLNYQKEDKTFLGWIFKSSQYISSPINATFDIKLENCLLKDPIFLKKVI